MQIYADMNDLRTHVEHFIQNAIHSGWFKLSVHLFVVKDIGLLTDQLLLYSQLRQLGSRILAIVLLNYVASLLSGLSFCFGRYNNQGPMHRLTAQSSLSIRSLICLFI